MSLIRLAIIALFALALICAAGSSWPLWTVAGLLEPVLAPIVASARPPQ